ncbi:hypothetical protein BpHYR1_031692, partial [Brachionus plicatilis]
MCSPAECRRWRSRISCLISTFIHSWSPLVLTIRNGLHESVDGAVRVCFNVSEKGIDVKLSYCSNCVA